MKATDIRLLGSKILVRRYEKPELYNDAIVIPDQYRKDLSGTLWEYIKGGPQAADVLGMNVGEGEILRTPPWPAVHIGDDLWVMEAGAVAEIMLWKGEDDES